jgi:LysR family carnitine catabolism transcriptional activator
MWMNNGPAPTLPSTLIDTLSPGDLEVFVAVAQLGSFRAASLHLGLSQPAVTQRIKRLESQVGLKLFNRSTRRVELTDVGLKFKSRAERLVHELDRTLRDLRDQAQVRAGRVNFGVSHSMMVPYAIPAVMMNYVREFPGVRLNLVDVGWNALLSQLTDGRIDLAFVSQEGLSPSLNCETLFIEELVPVASRSLFPGRRCQLTPEEFVRLPVVGVTVNSAIYRQLRALHESVGAPYTPVQEASRLSSVIGMMLAGLGVAVLPRHMVPSLGEVVELSVQGVRFERAVGMVRDGRRALSPAAERFAQAARVHFRRTRGLPPG